MSTATAEAPPVKPKGVDNLDSTTMVTYTPLGEAEPVILTLARVKKFLCVPTKSGKLPSDEQVMKYMMLCKAQSLNPWLNDCYLVGYDSADGPNFSLITAHQAFLKRAEASPEFDGIESGVVVLRGEVMTERAGDLLLKGEVLIGAWARVHRRDRKIPSYDALNFATFDTGRSRWKADPAGMIVKVAEASALRKAFPSTLAAMYCKEEMDRERNAAGDVANPSTVPLTLAAVTAPLAITATPSEFSFIREDMPDRRQMEPAKTAKPVETPKQQERKPPNDAAAAFVARINSAATTDDLDSIGMELQMGLSDGGVTKAEFSVLSDMLETQRNEWSKT